MDISLTTFLNPDLEEAISKFPSMTAMARDLGLSGYQVIQEWRRQGRVPAEHCPEIERFTGVRCEKLNSRVDWAYVRGTAPELVQQKETA
ncbi:Cro/Cl family transcriptional regulator [Burkholderia cepacia]|uniref:transcriptional regulator n=1 Tax=Burkholderia cepacia TaxID=292 RepID=UPI000F5F7F27|nr:YdaS family helix-turn-helix protein [Burkholderia cepacia]RQZ58131.1 Cro/Cl family transcriptional regulator [Burkholderia cepacia]